MTILKLHAYDYIYSFDKKQILHTNMSYLVTGILFPTH